MIGSGIGSVTHLCGISIQCATEPRRGAGRGKLRPVQMWQGYLVGLGDVPACDPQHDTHHSPRFSVPHEAARAAVAFTAERCELIAAAHSSGPADRKRGCVCVCACVSACVQR